MAYAGPFFCSLLMTTITMSCGPDVDGVTKCVCICMVVSNFIYWVPPCNTAVTVSLWCSIIIIHMHMMHHNY